MFVHTAQFLFLLFLYQKESKFATRAVSLAAPDRPQVRDKVGFLLCLVGVHMCRLRHLGWEQCLHGLTSGPLETCPHQCPQAVCGGFGVIHLVQLRSF